MEICRVIQEIREILCMEEKIENEGGKCFFFNLL